MGLTGCSQTSQQHGAGEEERQSRAACLVLMLPLLSFNFCAFMQPQLSSPADWQWLHGSIELLGGSAMQHRGAGEGNGQPEWDNPHAVPTSNLISNHSSQTPSPTRSCYGAPKPLHPPQNTEQTHRRQIILEPIPEAAHVSGYYSSL